MSKYLGLVLFSLCIIQVSGQEIHFTDLTIESQIIQVQPMTGIVFWQGSNTDTDAISLEFSYMLFNDVVKDSGVYNWTIVEQKLNDIASRHHQAIFRFRDTYVGKTTSVPQYIKNRSDYHETEGISEGQTTWFPDWSNVEWQRFYLEFYTRFAEKYDHDARIAFIQVGFGLWAEYHIYDGPFELGKTFPSKAFQTQFLTLMGSVFAETPWSVSIDAADNTYSPFAENLDLMNLKFGNFDDSFMCNNHEGYNETCWNFFGHERYYSSPAGGEFSYYTDYDQQHVLDYPNGSHGKSYEEMAAKFQISYIIGNDQPEYQTMERIKQASMATGYKFKIVTAKTATDTTVLVIENIGISPFYYDAFPAVNGIRATESLKNLVPGQSREFHIASTCNGSNITIESDRLVAGQSIDFYGTTYNSLNKKKVNNEPWSIYPNPVSSGEKLQIEYANKTHEPVTVQIYNATGNMVQLQNITGNLSSVPVTLSPGIYLIKLVHSGFTSETKKMVIK